MIVTAWNNGAHSRNGSGYGFRVLDDDRDSAFQTDWKSIFLEIDGIEQAVEVAIDAEKLFGGGFYVIQSKELGMWMRRNGMAPWARGSAPVFELNPIEGNRFKVHKAGKQPGI